jgi:protein CpxP
MCVVEMNA